MRVAFGCDHRGFPYKTAVLDALSRDGHEVLDCGTNSTEPADYPDFARAVGRAVREGRADAGVLICGSGAGVAIAANKLRGVRAALCHDLMTARQCREDDDANVICLGASVVSVEQAIELIRTFLAARFSGAERHVRRLQKVLALEAAESAAPPALAVTDWPPVRDALGRLERQDAAARLWKKDPTLWSDAPAARTAIANRLGWLDAPAAMRAHVNDLRVFADEVQAEGVRDVVLLGMGGSSLAAEVLAASLPPPPGRPALGVLDTTDPTAVRRTRERLDPARTLFLVSSKSGTTVEMIALYRFFRAEVERATGTPGRHFVAITDPGTPLERLAAEGGFRRTFLNPPDVGGRFSALTLFGLVPAALIGADIAALLDRGAAMAEACGPGVPAAENPGLQLGAALGALAQAGRDKITFVISEPVAALGAWLEQLLTESTGKQGRGLVVVNDEPVGPAAAYGPDRVFVAITLGDDPAPACAVSPLEAAGHPVIRIGLGDRLDIGGEFFRWELATAVAGALLGVNPFDEPNVAAAKEATQAALATHRERGRLPDWPADSPDDLAAALAAARPGDYVALLAFVTPEPATTAAMTGLRRLIRDRTRLATTAGYGPRYLHSTGQLHKGGPPTAILVLLAGEDTEDVPIPGERYGFATLKMAQALGDLATLRAARRRALWLPFAGPAVDALERLRVVLGRRLG
ncbi:MAG: ribose 5-phosphate isomerase B [Candidatus Rokubacteria bacterium]|nr:ribose 5-phosphate isomerase B [Candidatus Rokubacteria bacterium]